MSIFIRNLLHTTSWLSYVILTATSASRTVDDCVIVEGGERDTAGWSLLREELGIGTGNIPSHCNKRDAQI